MLQPGTAPCGEPALGLHAPQVKVALPLAAFITAGGAELGHQLGLLKLVSSPS